MTDDDLARRVDEMNSFGIAAGTAGLAQHRKPLNEMSELDRNAYMRSAEYRGRQRDWRSYVGTEPRRRMTAEEADDILEMQIARGGGLPVTELEVEAARVHDRNELLSSEGQGELFTVSHDPGFVEGGVTVHDASGAVVPQEAAWRALLKNQADAYARGEAAYQATIEKLTKQNEELRRIAHGAVKAIDTLHDDVRAVLPGGHRLSKRLTHWKDRLKKLEG